MGRKVCKEYEFTKRKYREYYYRSVHGLRFHLSFFFFALLFKFEYVLYFFPKYLFSASNLTTNADRRTYCNIRGIHRVFSSCLSYFIKGREGGERHENLRSTFSVTLWRASTCNRHSRRFQIMHYFVQRRNSG